MNAPRLCIAVVFACGLFPACGDDTAASGADAAPSVADGAPSADGPSTADTAPPADTAALSDAATPETGATGDAGPSDAIPPDAIPPDAGPPPPAFAEECRRDDEGRCEAVRWRGSATTYPTVVDHHTTLITSSDDGDWLLVFGGIESTSLGDIAQVYDTVRRARVHEGEVEAFADEPPLPFPIAFHAQAITEDHVYLMAGVTADAEGPGANTTALVGRLEDGRVAEWRQAEMPREVRVHPTAAILGGRVVVVGGTAAGGTILDTVVSAPLGPDGMPGAFEPDAPLPGPRSHHAALVANGQLYILGGFTEGQVAEASLLRALQDEAGRIAGWEEVGRLEGAPWTASAVAYRGWIWLVGGGEGDGDEAHFVPTVRAAPLLPDGGLGPFETFADPLPRARSHVHQTPVHAGFIYSVGGRAMEGGGMTSIDRLYTGRLW